MTIKLSGCFKAGLRSNCEMWGLWFLRSPILFLTPLYLLLLICPDNIHSSWLFNLTSHEILLWTVFSCKSLRQGTSLISKNKKFLHPCIFNTSMNPSGNVIFSNIRNSWSWFVDLIPISPNSTCGYYVSVICLASDDKGQSIIWLCGGRLPQDSSKIKL